MRAGWHKLEALTLGIRAVTHCNSINNYTQYPVTQQTTHNTNTHTMSTQTQRSRRSTITTPATTPVVPPIVQTVSKPLCLSAFRLGFARAAERCPDSQHLICTHFNVGSPDDIIRTKSASLGEATQSISDGLGKVMRSDKVAARVILITAESLLRNPRPGYRGSVEDADNIRQFLDDKLPAEKQEATVVTADWV